MIQDVCHAGDEGLQEKVCIKSYKNPVHVNENMAIGLFKEEFIKIMIEPSERLRENKLLRLQESIERYILPFRESKSKDRKHNISKNIKTIKKAVFKSKQRAILKRYRRYVYFLLLFTSL